MKKIMLTLCLVLFVSSAYAGSCPMLAKNIDEKIKKAQELKDQGMDAHNNGDHAKSCLLYTSPSPRDKRQSRMPSSA